jgi:hypothetical protein
MAVPDPQGWKEVSVNDVETAAGYQGYVLQQIIAVFADATARDAAITEPKEGQHAYLKDTDTLTYYDGAAWEAVGGAGESTGTPLPRGVATTAYWGTPGWHLLTTGLGSFPIADTLLYIPISLARTATFDRIGIEVTTGAGTSARLGICRIAPDGSPGELIVDAGLVSIASAAAVSATIDVTMTPGNYYLLLCCDNTPTLRRFATGTPASSGIESSQFSTVPTRVITQRTGYGVGAFTDPPPASNSASMYGPENMSVQLREKAD